MYFRYNLQKRSLCCIDMHFLLYIWYHDVPETRELFPPNFLFLNPTTGTFTSSSSSLGSVGKAFSCTRKRNKSSSSGVRALSFPTSVVPIFNGTSLEYGSGLSSFFTLSFESSS